MTIRFFVREDPEGGYVATATGAHYALTVCAPMWEDLEQEIRSACGCFFDDLTLRRSGHTPQSPVLAVYHAVLQPGHPGPPIVIECQRLAHGWSAIEPLQRRILSAASFGKLESLCQALMDCPELRPSPVILSYEGMVGYVGEFRSEDKR